jgi:hypothetical protein
MMTDMWEKYAGDFDAMTDEEIDIETRQAQFLIDENEEWVEAVAMWKAAGKPRNAKEHTT